jgi:hypothetical protein
MVCLASKNVSQIKVTHYFNIINAWNESIFRPLIKIYLGLNCSCIKDQKNEMQNFRTLKS